jgi:hypothetical protein
LSNRALDTIDTVVATVNDKAIRPAIVAARGVVFGVIIAVVALTVVVLFCVGLHPPDHHPGHTCGPPTWCWAHLLPSGGRLVLKRGGAPHSDD